jgi:hypothetical protein
MRRLTDLQERAGSKTVSIQWNETVWMVIDPMSADSELEDLSGETTLASIGRQVKGGLDIAKEHLTIYTGPNAELDARKDAEIRLRLRGSA